MAIPKWHLWSTIIACLAFFSGFGFAQRPSTATVCDFYAQARYGANSSETQLKFIQNVVCLAFEGGSKLNNVSSELTGILRPGKFNGIDISLLQYFNGSRASTNVNNAPIGIPWLDQGGTIPLASFLAGESQTLNLSSSSNQYHLFSNFFVAFSRSFGCTLPPPPLPNSNGPVSLAYAHKFMNLEYHQLGYFINQLTLSAMHFGVSSQDADSFNKTLNNRFNVRCSPATSSPPQLLSLCQNPTCPLAVPVSDCAAYTNLTANGMGDNNLVATVTASITKTTVASGTASAIPTTDAAVPTSSGKLSTGGIAGAAIGGAAVLLIAVIALVFLLRKRKTSAASEPAPTPTWSQQHYDSSKFPPKDAHQSYYSAGQPPSEMDTSRYSNRMDGTSPPNSPEPAAYQAFRPNSEQPREIWNSTAVEMHGSLPGGGVSTSPPPPHNAAWPQTQGQSDGTQFQGQMRDVPHQQQ